MDAAGGKRKTFYPYSKDPHNIEISVNLNCSDWSNIQPSDVTITLGPDPLKEQINTWLDVYGIEERYKAKCCGKSDGYGWIKNVLDDCKEAGIPPDESLQILARHAARRPYAEANFLKKAFLDGCQRAGLFDNQGSNQ
jgi:hypothetical protein